MAWLDFHYQISGGLSFDAVVESRLPVFISTYDPHGIMEIVPLSIRYINASAQAYVVTL